MDPSVEKQRKVNTVRRDTIDTSLFVEVVGEEPL